MSASRKTHTAAIVFLVCTVGILAMVSLAHWEPAADFDIVGVLWLMQNILPVTVVLALLAGATGAAVVFVQSWVADRKGADRR